MDSLHLALVVHAVYFYAVTNFTNVFMLDVPTWYVSVDFCSSVMSHCWMSQEYIGEHTLKRQVVNELTLR